MPKVKSKYQAKWQSTYDWLRPGTGEHYAKCVLCAKEFSVANAGLAQVRQHNDSDKHSRVVNTLSGLTSQSILVRRTDPQQSSVVDLNAGRSFCLTSEEEVIRAEILWAMKCVESNFSFYSNTGLPDLFRVMFSDSKIAKNYAMSETKNRYVIQFGIAPVVLERLQEDLHGEPFTFKFDETTTSQVKKQYDAYVQYNSRAYNRVVNHYVGSMFHGHCTSETLKNNFFAFGKKLKWDVAYLLHLGMDGPRVNTSFQRELEEELRTQHNKSIIDIGTCNLHPVHTAFVKGLAALTFDFDQLAHDLHFFFKNSSARRSDFSLAEMETLLETQVMLRHVNSRWLSLKKVLTRIVDQWANLKQYFLVSLPKQNNFTREIAQTPRYRSIASALKSESSLAYISFAIYLAGIMEEFVVKYQSNDPLIHTLYDASGKLLFDVMSNFIVGDALKKSNGHQNEACVLGKINVEDSKLQISIHEINFGTKTKQQIASLEAKINADVIKSEMKLCFLKATVYLQKHLPHNSHFLRDMRVVQPEFKTRSNAVSSIGRLAVVVARVLNGVSIYTKTPEILADDIMREYQHFQTEDIEHDLSKPADFFWRKVGDIRGTDGQLCFTKLATLAKHCLCLSHGNAVPERGFSVNKLLLQDRELLKEETIVVLRLVKESLLLRSTQVHDYTMSRRLLESVSNARSAYMAHLQAEKDEEEAAKRNKRKRKEHESQQDVRQQLNDALKNEQQKLKAAQNLSESGRAKLNAALSTPSLQKSALLEAQSLIQLGSDKMQLSQSKIDQLNKDLALLPKIK